MTIGCDGVSGGATLAAPETLPHGPFSERSGSAGPIWKKGVPNRIAGSRKRSVVCPAAGLFDGTDALFHQPSVPTADVVVPVVPARNLVTEEIVSRVFVASSFSSQVVRSFELKTKLPKFCMFTVIKARRTQPGPCFLSLSLLSSAAPCPAPFTAVQRRRGDRFPPALP